MVGTLHSSVPASVIAGTACFQVRKDVLRGMGLAEVSWHDSSEVAEQLERVYLEEAVMSYQLLLDVFLSLLKSLFLGLLVQGREAGHPCRLMG